MTNFFLGVKGVKEVTAPFHLFNLSLFHLLIYPFHLSPSLGRVGEGLYPPPGDYRGLSYSLN